MQYVTSPSCEFMGHLKIGIKQENFSNYQFQINPCTELFGTTVLIMTSDDQGPVITMQTQDASMSIHCYSVLRSIN